MFDGGIHFTASPNQPKYRQTSAGSTTSMQSIAGTLTRVNTVASALKRLFSKDGQSPVPGGGSGATPGALDGSIRLPTSASAASLHSKFPMAGSMRITDQVIEEDDEQMTITSMRGQLEVRPTAQSLFQNITQVQQKSEKATLGPVSSTTNSGSNVSHSAPMDIPKRNISYMRTVSAISHQGGGATTSIYPPGGIDALLSTSAPVGVRPKSIEFADRIVEENETSDGDGKFEFSYKLILYHFKIFFSLLHTQFYKC